MIDPDTVELAGFCVGVLERSQVDPPEPVRSGDRVVGFPSSGFHANGYSLIRRILDARSEVAGETVPSSLLSRTRIYTDVAGSLREAGLSPKARVHVTGGGIPGNLSRVLPDGLGAVLELPPWTPKQARMILRDVPIEEAVRTFNMGFGWLCVFGEDAAGRVLDRFSGARPLGRVQPGNVEVEVRDE